MRNDSILRRSRCVVNSEALGQVLVLRFQLAERVCEVDYISLLPFTTVHNARNIEVRSHRVGSQIGFPRHSKHKPMSLNLLWNFDALVLVQVDRLFLIRPPWKQNRRWPGCRSATVVLEPTSQASLDEEKEECREGCPDNGRKTIRCPYLGRQWSMSQLASPERPDRYSWIETATRDRTNGNCGCSDREADGNAEEVINHVGISLVAIALSLVYGSGNVQHYVAQSCGVKDLNPYGCTQGVMPLRLQGERVIEDREIG
mmetsp:Transcript_50845/g.80592  ORF Transcript_50845/g.80592 Transcript_50845/m.80592 type:complete len:258 (+) Transcript_50845:556-1329(+)